MEDYKKIMEEYKKITTEIQIMTSDLKETKFELQRIRHHQDCQKIVNIETASVLNEIKNALVGTFLNGNNGVISQVAKICLRVDDLDEFRSEISVYVRQGKFIAGTLVVLMLGILVKLFEMKS